MEIIQDSTDFQLDRETAVAIGKFDGVHIGHRRLLEEILEQKKTGLLSCVFTFDPPPAVLFGFSDGMELTTREEKREIFARMGVDIVIEFPLTKETAGISPESFVRDVLAEQMQVRFVAAGCDLSFGAGGAGNVDLLRKMSQDYYFQAKIIEKVFWEEQEVSSTLIRGYVEQGDMRMADRLLGMPYLIRGVVMRGAHIGHSLGFPTVNLLPPSRKLLPPNGVYYSRVTHGEKRYRAITNVGCKPTVSEKREMGVESYLFDFDADLYGETIEVELLEFRRPERQFADREALAEQLARDIAAGEAYRW